MPEQLLSTAVQAAELRKHEVSRIEKLYRNDLIESILKQRYPNYSNLDRKNVRRNLNKKPTEEILLYDLNLEQSKVAPILYASQWMVYVGCMHKEYEEWAQKNLSANFSKSLDYLSTACSLSQVALLFYQWPLLLGFIPVLMINKFNHWLSNDAWFSVATNALVNFTIIPLVIILGSLITATSQTPQMVVQKTLQLYQYAVPTTSQPRERQTVSFSDPLVTGISHIAARVNTIDSKKKNLAC